MKRFAQLVAFFIGTFIAVVFRSNFDSRHVISIGDILFGSIIGGGIAASVVGAFFNDRTASQTHVPPNLITDLQQGNDQQRRAASYKLGNFNDPKAVTALIGAYSDTDSIVRRNVIDGLRTIGTKEALDFLKSHNLQNEQKKDGIQTLENSGKNGLATKIPTDNPNLVLCSNCGHTNYKGNTQCSKCVTSFVVEIIQKELNTTAESNKSTPESQKDVISPNRSADEWCNEGNSLASKGQYNEAIACLEEALQIDPKHALSWFNMGLILMNLGRNPEAVTAFNTFIEYAPPQAQATHVPVAKSYIQMLSQGDTSIISPQSTSEHITLEPEEKKSPYQKPEVIASIIFGFLGFFLGCGGILSISISSTSTETVWFIILFFPLSILFIVISIRFGISAARGKQAPK